MDKPTPLIHRLYYISPNNAVVNDEDLRTLERRLSALQADARWIPVGERLPDESVLCALINFERHQSDHYGTPVAQCGYLSTQASSQPYWSIYGERATSIEAFTHWMPLPAAHDAALNAREGKS